MYGKIKERDKPKNKSSSHKNSTSEVIKENYYNAFEIWSYSNSLEQERKRGQNTNLQKQS
jgi:hypothetical protein